jgi:hypothetical protein
LAHVRKEISFIWTVFASTARSRLSVLKVRLWTSSAERRDRKRIKAEEERQRLMKIGRRLTKEV